jgi:hypothetical protein
MMFPDGRGVGKAHKNRRPRRGPRLSWLHKTEEILVRLDETRQQYFDRHDLEGLFDLRTAAAGRLLRQVGPTEELGAILGAGTRLQARVVSRRDLLLFMGRARASNQFLEERMRHDTLLEHLADARRHLAARRVRIAVDPAAVDMTSLPAGVQLRPGHLEIDFFGAEDLLTQLYGLATAMAGDFHTFQRMLEKP